MYALEVAPISGTSWVTRGRKRGELADLWGVCRSSEPGILKIALRWQDSDCSFEVNRRVLTAYMSGLKQAEGDVPEEATREIRAYVCQCLAGPIADMISERKMGQLVASGERSPRDDLTLAEACCRMLSAGNEWEHLCDVTETLLRERWGSVEKLADALESDGKIEGTIGSYLPPRIQNWPPAPKSQCQDKVL